MNPRPWLNWHIWAGFTFWLLLSFVLITGTLATVSVEIDWLFNSHMRNNSATLDKLDWGAMLDKGEAAFPASKIAFIGAPPTTFINPQAVAINKQGERFRIFFDPVTFDVIGTGRWLNWQRFFRQTHRHLMLPVKWGVTIVGLLAIPLFISFCSAFVIYRRWWRGFFKFPTHSQFIDKKLPIKQAHSYWGAMHRLLGVWSLWFILLMAITGMWYLVERWGLAAQYPALPKVDTAEQSLLTGDKLNQFISKAARVYPELVIKQVHLHRQNFNVVMLQGQAKAVLVRDRANQLAFNLATGELIDKRRGVDLGVHLRISEAADPLHFGTLGGKATRYIWFLFGLMLSILSLSGVFLYGLRLMRKAPELRAKRASHAWLCVWQKQGFMSKWATLLMVVVSLLLAVFYFVVI